MEIRQLEYFKAICNELHFTRAAEKLGITQPTLSYQIKQLEDELGVQLFDRIGKRITLTEAGSILLRHSQTIFRSLNGVREEISELHRLVRGTLTIGTLIGEINELVSEIVVDFHKKHPALQIKLLALEDVLEPLLLQELDLAVTIFPIADERISTMPLYEEEFYAVVPSDHRFARQDSVALESLLREPFVVFPKTHRCRQMLDEVCSTLGTSMKLAVETSSIESVLKLVQAGAGLSVLSKTLLSLYPRPQLTPVRVKSPSLRREVGIAMLKDRYVGKASMAFISSLKSHIFSESAGLEL